MANQLSIIPGFGPEVSTAVVKMNSAGSLYRFVQSGAAGKKHRATFRPDYTALSNLRDKWFLGDDFVFNFSSRGSYYAEVFNSYLHIIKTATLETMIFVKIDIPESLNFKHHKGLFGVGDIFWKDEEYVCLGYNGGLIQVFDLCGRCVASKKLQGYFGEGSWNGHLLAMSFFPTTDDENAGKVGTFIYNARNFFQGKDQDIQLLDDITNSVGGIANTLAWVRDKQVLLGVCSYFHGEKNYDSIVWSFDLITRKYRVISSEEATQGCAPGLSAFSADGSWAIGMLKEFIVLNRQNVVINRIPIPNHPDYHLVPRMAPDGTFFVYNWIDEKGYLMISPGCTDFVPIPLPDNMPEYSLKAILPDKRSYAVAKTGMHQHFLLDSTKQTIVMTRSPEVLLVGVDGFDINKNGNLAIAALGDDSIRIFSSDLDCLHVLRCGARAGNPHNVKWIDGINLGVVTCKKKGVVFNVDSHESLCKTEKVEHIAVYRGKPVWSKETIASNGGINAKITSKDSISIEHKGSGTCLNAGSEINSVAFHKDGLVILSAADLVFIDMSTLKEIVKSPDKSKEQIQAREFGRRILVNGDQKFTRVAIDKNTVVLTSDNEIVVYNYNKRTCEFGHRATKQLSMCIKAFPDSIGKRIIVCRRVRYTFLTEELKRIADLYLLHNDNYLIHVRAPFSAKTHPGYLFASGGSFEFLFRCWDERGRAIADPSRKNLCMSRFTNKEMVELALKPECANEYLAAHERLLSFTPSVERFAYCTALPDNKKNISSVEDKKCQK